jgi:nicotinamidase-related amidase
MSLFEAEFGSPKPQQIAVLFIDLQYRWTYGRNRTLLPHIVHFARALRQTDIRQLWIGDRIGESFEVPKAVSSLCPVESFQRTLPDNRFIYDLSDMRGAIVDKQADDAFTNTHLARKLKSSGITTVLGCGFIAGQCVMSTLEGARSHGFKTGLISDCSIDNNPCGGFGKWAVDHQRFARVQSLESREVFDYLSRQRLKHRPNIVLAANDIVSLEVHGLSGFRDRYSTAMPFRQVASPAEILAAKAQHLQRFLLSLKQISVPPMPKIFLPKAGLAL